MKRTKTTSRPSLFLKITCNSSLLFILSFRILPILTNNLLSCSVRCRSRRCSRYRSSRSTSKRIFFVLLLGPIVPCTMAVVIRSTNVVFALVVNNETKMLLQWTSRKIMTLIVSFGVATNRTVGMLEKFRSNVLCANCSHRGKEVRTTKQACSSRSTRRSRSGAGSTSRWTSEMPTGNGRHVAIVNNFGSGKKIRNVLRKSIAIREILEGTFIMLELLEIIIQRIMLSIGSLEEATL